MREWGESSAVFVVAKGENFFRTAFSCTAPVPRPRRLVGWRGCPLDARLLPRMEPRGRLLTWSRFFEILVCQFHHEEVGTFSHPLPLFTTKFAKQFATEGIQTKDPPKRVLGRKELGGGSCCGGGTLLLLLFLLFFFGELLQIRENSLSSLIEELFLLLHEFFYSNL